MSRSYRKPFACITGSPSAKKDKTIAHRCARRKQNRVAKAMAFNEDLIMPSYRECAHNDVWGWDRDGKQRPCWPTAKDWSHHCLSNLAKEGLADSWFFRWYVEMGD